MAISDITNGEAGSDVREKLNEVISETNYFDTGFYPKIDLVSQSGYYANADSSVLTSSGTLGSFELLTLEEGRTYTIQGYNSGLDSLSYAAYAFDSDGLNGAQISKNTYTIFSSSAFSFVVPEGKPKIGVICFIADFDTITLALGSSISEADTAQIKPDSLANSNFFSKINTQYFDDLSVKFIAGVFRVYAQIPFSNGSTEPSVGDSIVGETSGASYDLIATELTSGTFAGGDAAGNFIVDAGSSYLSDPYSSGENLQVSASTIAVKTATAASGRWWQIGGSHDPMNVASFENITSGFRIVYGFTADSVISLIASPDETFANLGFLTGASVGIQNSDISVRKLKANTTTGVISSDDTDFSDLNNANESANVWVLGIVKV